MYNCCMRHDEDDQQAEFFKWLGFQYPEVSMLTFHIPNGGVRNPREAGRLKAQGVRAGVPDVFVAVPVSPYAGLFIEFKRRIVAGVTKPRLTDVQTVWVERLRKSGYCVKVCYGAESGIEIIKLYLQGELSDVET